MLYPRASPRRHVRVFVFFLFASISLWWFTSTSTGVKSVGNLHRATSIHDRLEHHPLDDAINEARHKHQSTLLEQTNNLKDGMTAYQHRRGRPPPPGFDKWYARALKSNAVIVESFFDQIYEDLEPFWGLEPAVLRKSLTNWKWTIQVRNGRVKDVPQGRFRSRMWGKMIGNVAKDLPDMNVAINPFDEPRVLAPWKEVAALMTKAGLQKERMGYLTASELSKRPARALIDKDNSAVPRNWTTKGDIWPFVLATCPPEKQNTTSNELEALTVPTTNWTTSKDLCSNHHWHSQHGALLKPATLNMTTSFLPIFSAAKLQGNNDILLPPPAYYSEDALFTGSTWLGDGKQSIPWARKLHSLVWRGKATGGALTPSTWHASHRHRLVSMLNSSEVEANSNSTISFTSTTESQSPRSIASWLAHTADAAFTDLMCPTGKHETCKNLPSHFKTLPSLPMKKQYAQKYLPDIDGNSLSGRFRAFMLSNSAPIKATIFKEWHDARLMPWVHFIHVDITLKDLWALLGYFLGVGEGFAGGHDAEGERIATEGRVWGERVLRREDMELYALRVLLEYARILDDGRDELGLVAVG